MTCNCHECVLRRRVDFISDYAPPNLDLEYLTDDGAVFSMDHVAINALEGSDYVPPFRRNAYLGTKDHGHVFIPTEDLDEVFSIIRQHL